MNAFRYLCACLSGVLGSPRVDTKLPASPAEWERILRLAGAHLVLPQLRWALRQQGLFAALPADVADYLDAVYTLNLERNRSSEEQLVELVSELNGIGVAPVLLKGAAALVDGLYPTAGERMMSDLDVLVPANRLPEVLPALAAVGYRPSVDAGERLPDPVGYQKVGHHYPALISSDWSCRVELHVHPVHLPFAGLLPSDEVFADGRQPDWRGGCCALPSETHFLMHNLIHSFLNNTLLRLQRVSLRQLFEFVLASQRYGGAIDWPKLHERFARHGYENECRRYLALAQECLDFAPQYAGEPAIDSRDRNANAWEIFRLEADSRGLEWTLNAAAQIRARLERVRREPGRIRMLTKARFYSNFFRSLGR